MATDSQMMSTDYKQGDLKKLPKGTRTFMLKIRVEVIMSPHANFSYEGEIEVTRVDRFTFTFKFMVDGIQYEFIDGHLFCANCNSPDCERDPESIGFSMYTVSGLQHCECIVFLL